MASLSTGLVDARTWRHLNSWIGSAAVWKFKSLETAQAVVTTLSLPILLMEWYEALIISTHTKYSTLAKGMERASTNSFPLWRNTPKTKQLYVSFQISQEICHTLVPVSK